MKFDFCRELVPAWYELSHPDTSIIRFAVHQVALDHMKATDWEKAPAVKLIKERFKISTFTAPCDGSCGFNDVFHQSQSPHENWVAWDCRLPIMKSSSGANEDPFEYFMAVRATFWLFSTNLWLFEGNTGWSQPQLMLIEGICLPTDEHRMNTGALSVTLSPKVIQWLSRQDHACHIESIVTALKSASSHMWASNSDGGGFGALFRKPKWLNLDVPGDACGLDPDSYYDESLETGYTLQPHNVDSSLQQLTFLAGLARLHDLVRQDG